MVNSKENSGQDLQAALVAFFNGNPNLLEMLPEVAAGDKLTWMTTEGNSEGGNLYHYVYNNPINSIDPFGLDLWIIHDNCSEFLGIIDIGHSVVVGENGDGTYWDSDLNPGDGPLKPLNCPADIGFNDPGRFDPNNLQGCWVITRHVVTSPAVDRKAREEAKRRADADKGRYDLAGNNCRSYANAICDYALGAKLREMIENRKKSQKR